MEGDEKKKLTMGIFFAFKFCKNVHDENRIAGQIELTFRPHNIHNGDQLFQRILRRRLRTFFFSFPLSIRVCISHNALHMYDRVQIKGTECEQNVSNNNLLKNCI
jgi:hypothetical protein